MPPKARVQKRLYYKIGEACKVLDIQPYVLRYWETEFPALSPSKSRSGQRVYSEKELAIIRRIKELLYGEGYTIAGAKKKLEGELASGVLGAPDRDDEPEAAGADEPTLAFEPLAPPAAKILELPLRPEPEAPPLKGPAELPLHVEVPEPQPVAAEPDPRPEPAALDTSAAERVQRMRTGIQKALAEAREILALLES